MKPKSPPSLLIPTSLPTPTPIQSSVSTIAVVFLLLFLLFVAEIDLVGEVVVEVDVRFSSKRVFGDGLEGLLHVDRLFRGSLEVGNVAFRVAPLLRTLYRYLKRKKR